MNAMLSQVSKGREENARIGHRSSLLELDAPLATRALGGGLRARFYVEG